MKVSCPCILLLAVFSMVYPFLFVWHSSTSLYIYFNPSSFVRCSVRECHHDNKIEIGMKTTAALEEPLKDHQSTRKRAMMKREKPSFLDEMAGGKRIGMVNMDDEDLSEWNSLGETIPIYFEQVSDQQLKWKDLFPEWIQEEVENSCPEIPMADFDSYNSLDMVVAKLPIKKHDHGQDQEEDASAGRDVFSLQVHLIVANLAVRSLRKMKVVFLSKFRPMPDLFRCEDLSGQEGDWWFYEPDLTRLEYIVSMPVGSCNLARGQQWSKKRNFDREAYATVLHSSEIYVCGAITLAQSLRRTGTRRDLLLLLDSSISGSKRAALENSGWKLRFIERIRNPGAKNGSYNEYNYSKFRLWQLTDYDKIVFIDSDILVLRNLDALFRYPQISAVGNRKSLFNSGVMVIEPSDCTFRMLMQRTKEIVSYNGGDQGFLNQVFVRWHRLPRKVNFFKHSRSNSAAKSSAGSNQLLRSDPPEEIYAIHYFGLKPWRCYRDYDCNWDVEELVIYASDDAHGKWWKLHDAMDEGLQKFCGLDEQRKIKLELLRKKAREMKLENGRWKINVTDPRKFCTIKLRIRRVRVSEPLQTLCKNLPSPP